MDHGHSPSSSEAPGSRRRQGTRRLRYRVSGSRGNRSRWDAGGTPPSLPTGGLTGSMVPKPRPSAIRLPCGIGPRLTGVCGMRVVSRNASSSIGVVAGSRSRRGAGHTIIRATPSFRDRGAVALRTGPGDLKTTTFFFGFLNEMVLVGFIPRTNQGILRCLPSSLLLHVHRIHELCLGRGNRRIA